MLTGLDWTGLDDTWVSFVSGLLERIETFQSREKWANSYIHGQLGWPAPGGCPLWDKIAQVLFLKCGQNDRFPFFGPILVCPTLSVPRWLAAPWR